MNGLDCLREELLARGCTIQQAESKVVAVVLDIVSNGGVKYTQIHREEQGLTEKVAKKRHENDALDRSIRNKKAMIEKINIDYLRIRAEYEKKIEELKAQVEHLESLLSACETPEGRDAIRKAQFFMSKAEPKTQQNTTAYIYALGMVLGGGNAAKEVSG